MGMKKTIDATFIDVKKEVGSIPVRRISIEFEVYFIGPHAIINKKNNSNYNRKIPASIFKANFELLRSEGDIYIYKKRSSLSYAIEMHSRFTINSCAITGVGSIFVGEKGDYLITKNSLINKVVKREEMWTQYYIDQENNLNEALD